MTNRGNTATPSPAMWCVTTIGVGDDHAGGHPDHDRRHERPIELGEDVGRFVGEQLGFGVDDQRGGVAGCIDLGDTRSGSEGVEVEPVDPAVAPDLLRRRGERGGGESFDGGQTHVGPRFHRVRVPRQG